jgi:hypothetical protein
MNLTEAKAKEKRCVQPWRDLCRGAGCMAWRWSQPLRRTVRLAENYGETSEPPRPPHVPAHWPFVPFDESEGDPAGWVEPLEDAQARRTGYCGLAGVPGIEGA